LELARGLPQHHHDSQVSENEARADALSHEALALEIQSTSTRDIML
jgi:hypothetical protein